MMSDNQRKINILLGIVVVICIIGSFIYINKEQHHDCTGQGCPVCMQIHAAQDLLNSIKAIVIIGFLCLAIKNFKLQMSYGLKGVSYRWTPVTLKVKLLN